MAYSRSNYGRRSKAQLNAISRSYAEKNKAKINKVAENKGLDKVFAYQSKYKTIRGLVNASSDNLRIATAQALEKAEKKKNNLIKSGAKSKEGSSLYNVKKDIQVIKSVCSAIKDKPKTKKVREMKGRK